MQGKPLLSSGLAHTSTSDKYDEALGPATFGERCADWITNLYGSWLAFWGQSIFLLAWMVLNALVLLGSWRIPHWDPYPFTFLNLFLSSEAAFSTTFVLMSQNRAAGRDRALLEMTTQSTMRNEAQMDSIEERLALGMINQQKVISQLKSNALMLQAVIEQQDEILRQLGVLTHAS